VTAAKRKAQEAPTVKIQLDENTRLKKYHDGLVKDVEEGEEINGWTRLSGAIAWLGMEHASSLRLWHASMTRMRYCA
jgi:hypothetical protein